IPLPLCSCGVIPTAIGLKNEKASKGAVASFLIATPQTGIDSILATLSLMGVGFAVIRPVAALVTGVCGGLLVNRYVKNNQAQPAQDVCTDDCCQTEDKQNGNLIKRIYKVFKYAYFDMVQGIGLRLIIGLVLAALINIAVPDEFFLYFGSQPLLQMSVILIIAVPMYICSTGSIPIAAALILKGLSPGAALVMLMAGPAVNLASILVVKKSLGFKFTLIYLLTVVVGSVAFGLAANAFQPYLDLNVVQSTANCCSACEDNTCCNSPKETFSWFRTVCSVLLTGFIIIALTMKFLHRFTKPQAAAGKQIYAVEGMHCNHCKAAVELAVKKVKGVQSAEADVAANTLTVEGNAAEEKIRLAVEQAGFTFKGKKE
ncbi:MAG: permease, partial [Bacteroidales bacterium]|nr:permease [Bacteroidales bacterium]